MKQYFQKSIHALVILFCVVGTLAVAQAIPLSQAPNDAITGQTSPAILGPLAVGTSTVPGSGVGLSVGGELLARRDYVGKQGSFNCLASASTGSNKCHTKLKLIGSTDPARSNFPEIISLGSANIAGQSGTGVIVVGKTTDALVSDGSFPTLTTGVKLFISDTSTTLQGDPGASYMNHAGGYTFPGANCTDPTNPACKKVLCVDASTGTTVSCANSTQATTYTPQRPSCSDGIDNDGDNLIDGQDLGCYCSNSYSQTGARSCGPAATEASANNPSCPMPC